jgi:glycosyltransferase involved in cell wall biosynthesis
MRHIVHVSDARGWRGGENQTFLLIAGLVSIGRQCTLVAETESPLAHACARAGCAVLPVRFRGAGLAGALARIRRVCRPGAADIVHAHTARAHSLVALSRIACCAAPPLIVTRRNCFQARSGPVSKAKYQSADHIIAISTPISRQLVDRGVSQDRISIIPSGIDVNTFDGVAPLSRDELRIPGHVTVIGTIAALTREKGHETLLLAASRLKRSAQDIHVLIVGDGPRAAALRDHSRELGLTSCTTFTGHRTDIERIFPLLDICVLPSHTEGLGTVILDALLAGIPVVASRVGGIPDIITDGRNGLLFDDGDSEGLADRLTALRNDEAMRSRLIAAGRATVKAFDIRTTVARTASLYQAVCT